MTGQRETSAFPLPCGTDLGQLRLEVVFDYHDGPRLFACRNTAAQAFLGLWVDESEDGDSWLYLRLSPARMNELQRGSLDIRGAFLSAEEGWVMEIGTSPSGALRYARWIDAEDLALDSLPEPGETLEEQRAPVVSAAA